MKIARIMLMYRAVSWWHIALARGSLRGMGWNTLESMLSETHGLGNSRNKIKLWRSQTDQERQWTSLMTDCGIGCGKRGQRESNWRYISITWMWNLSIASCPASFIRRGLLVGIKSNQGRGGMFFLIKSYNINTYEFCLKISAGKKPLKNVLSQ